MFILRTVILIDLAPQIDWLVVVVGTCIFILMNELALLGNIIHCSFPFVFFHFFCPILLNLVLVIYLMMTDCILFVSLIAFFKILILEDLTEIIHF